jgi:IS605 OrfB family transposase
MTSRRLRQIADPFVVAPPAGARVRTRLPVSPDDERVLGQVAGHLSQLASADLAERCRNGRLDARGTAISRRRRKQAMTALSSARWAGTITRTSEDAWQLAERNQQAEARSLRARVARIRRRLQVPAGGRAGRLRGYASQDERWQKQRHLQRLSARLAEIDQRLADGRVSICRGGRRLARTRHNLPDAGLTQVQWRERWTSQRWFLTADGEAAVWLGNLTIRWHPGEGWLELRLPAPLEHLANRPHGRWRLSAPVYFPYRGDDVAAQTQSGSVRYDIWFDPQRRRWYLDASWTFSTAHLSGLAELRQQPVLAVDLNVGQLAAWVIDVSGNPVGLPQTIPLVLDGLPAPARDGRLRGAISELLMMARTAGAMAIVIEDLDFSEPRAEGRERAERRPSRGRLGRSFRRAVAGIPTRRFRDRLVQMAANTGLAVIAVDPAYTSVWGAQHWLAPLTHRASPAVTVHHAATVVIGRRALGQRARRRVRCDLNPPEDGRGRAACPAARTMPTPVGLPSRRIRKAGTRQAGGQPRSRRQTRTADRAPPADQAAEDRSRSPAGPDSSSCPVSRNGMQPA